MALSSRFAASRLKASPRSLAGSALRWRSAPIRWFAVSDEKMPLMRNIGISAHIDSGKTTLTERILFYCGKTHAIHDVKGKDGVGAKMDHMELEREKGITITSAATYTSWKEHPVNIIDTPGHVDFTIEVERALRVLDGAILVLCGVAGVQSQSLTVDRQMRRYKVPRIAFINKLDRTGANPWPVLEGIRNMLGHNAAAVQIPIGVEFKHEGVVDLLTLQAYRFEGDNGEKIVITDCPAELKDEAEEKRQELIECVSEGDDALAELFLEGEEVSAEILEAAIRRTTLNRTFIPVFMGSAFKNKGVQPMLDGVGKFLPSPLDIENKALEYENDNKEVILESNSKKPFIGLAFKLEETKFGQVTYIRVYQGTLKKGDFLWDTKLGKKVKVPRVVKMHAADMEDVLEVGAGEIAAMFGVDCSSGTTFTKVGGEKLSMTSMYVPAPVISLAIRPKDKTAGLGNFSKALQRFQKEDPTFRLSFDAESNETIMSGMGELHLEIYAERLNREYGVECVVGNPQVNYRETIQKKCEFEFTHKKQTGGSGQYAKIMGYIEPIGEDEEGEGIDGETGPDRNEFVNGLSGNNVPPEYCPAIEKGFAEACAMGAAIGAPLQGVRFVVQDGAAHAVDSSELAFRTCAINATKQAVKDAMVQVLQPVMKVEVEIPGEFQGAVVGGLNQRRAMVEGVNAKGGSYCVIKCSVPLKEMFGYSTVLRGQTEGKGEFSMEYDHHAPVGGQDQLALEKEFNDAKNAKDSSR